MRWCSRPGPRAFQQLKFKQQFQFKQQLKFKQQLQLVKQQFQFICVIFQFRITRAPDRAADGSP